MTTADDRSVARYGSGRGWLARTGWKALFVPGVAGAGILALLGPVSASSARIVWNVSASAPAGLYYIEHGAWRVGDRVAVRPSNSLARELADRGVLGEGKLLIKRVAASGGDAVCRQGDTVTLNGRHVATAKVADSLGRALPIWSGCLTLTAADVFLLGDTAGSYDGRYSGAAQTREIVGRAILMLGF